MLIVAKNLRELSFGKLMDVYFEGNMEKAKRHWSGETESRGVALAEQEFYAYLQQVFFREEGAVYLIWESMGRYVSALRMEPWRDGLLLEALETAPQQRRKGYARNLMEAALSWAGEKKVYSHVHRDNAASLHVHEICGFKRILEYAVSLDGSVLPQMYTLCYDCSQ